MSEQEMAKITVKLDTDAKLELEKIAGEIQAKEGGSKTISDAARFLIKFYREHRMEVA